MSMEKREMIMGTNAIEGKPIFPVSVPQFSEADSGAKLRKYSCGCINVWAATPVQAACEVCGGETVSGSRRVSGTYIASVGRFPVRLHKSVMRPNGNEHLSGYPLWDVCAAREVLHK